MHKEVEAPEGSEERLVRTRQEFIDEAAKGRSERLTELSGQYHDALQETVERMIEKGSLPAEERDGWFLYAQAEAYLEAGLIDEARAVIDDALNGPVAYDPDCEKYRQEFELLLQQLAE